MYFDNRDYILNTLMKDPSGFYNPEGVSVLYNSTNRTITLSGDVKVYYQGKLVKSIYNGWVSDPHPTAFGVYFLYYRDGEIYWGTTSWSFSDIQIAFVYYSATDKFCIREVHGFMPHTVHNVLHHSIGCYTDSGGDLSSYTLSSTTATNRRPFVSECKIQDEDLSNTLPAHTSRLYTKTYLTTTGTTNFIVETADIVPLSGSRPYYNQYTGSAWQQTLMSNNTYQSIWAIAMPVSSGTNCQKYRYLWMQGQSNGNLTTEQSVSPANLNLGTLSNISPEFVFIAKVIIQYTGADWQIVQVNRLTGNKVNQTIYPSGNFLSTVATDGITITGNGTPSSPLVGSGTGSSVQADWSEIDSLQPDYIKNKPTLGTASSKDIPAVGNASVTEVVYGTDTRLTDSRVASDVYTWAKAATKPTYTYTEVGAEASGAVSTHAALTTGVHGSGTNTLIYSNDPRLTDSRTPIAHNQAESTITFTDITTGNVSSSAHGYCPKLPNNTTTFLRGDGSFSAPPTDSMTAAKISSLISIRF